jgi:chromosomal replication initiation ATPase DnaA
MLNISERLDSMQHTINRLQTEVDNLRARYLTTISVSHIPASSIELLEDVAKAFGLQVTDLTGRQRNKWLSYARVTAVCLLLQRGNSTPVVGRILGRRDHSTIISLRDRLERYRTECPLISEVMQNLSEEGVLPDE